MPFTKKEQKLMRDPNYEVTKETDQFVEMRSVSTGHCWNIFKNEFESGGKITLYHKQQENKPYYQKHGTFHTVAMAVEEMNRHDVFVLEKQNMPKSDIDTVDRNLHVYEGSDKHYKPVAQIRMQGKWLEELGFAPGTPFTVKCESGKLTLTI